MCLSTEAHQEIGHFICNESICKNSNHHPRVVCSLKKHFSMISRLVIIVLSIETMVPNFSSLDSQLNLALLANP